MSEIETEKATSWTDLPHRFQKDVNNICMCGRARGDALHATAVVQKAAVQTKIVTEKGS